MINSSNLDLTGRWIFLEDFGVGNDSGRLSWIEKGGVLEGELEFTEVLEDDAPFSIRLQIKGKRDGCHVKFKATSILWLQTDEPMTYNLDKWEGIVNPQGVVVGSSIDADGVCGVFTLRREE